MPSPVIKEIIAPETLTVKVSVSDSLSSGEYWLIPYILPIQEEVPPRLLQKIGSNSLTFHRDFLNITFKRQDGSFFLN